LYGCRFLLRIEFEQQCALRIDRAMKSRESIVYVLGLELLRFLAVRCKFVQSVAA